MTTPIMLIKPILTRVTGNPIIGINQPKMAICGMAKIIAIVG